jgi:adenylate cyclase
LIPIGLSMAKDRLSSKLAVILHADVVGSTLLVQQNETLAHERIQGAFHRFSETIRTYGGIAREIRGDALVAEFDRASDAVTAAIAFQAKNEACNKSLDVDIRPSLRIGISLGEVIVADGTITGTGVVLAQRLEQLAEPGGVVVQGSVSETVPTRMPFEFESMGERILKGFDQPVRAFAVNLRSGEELPTSEGIAVLKIERPRSFQVPDLPSIAVLPFTNMSADPEQDFFADGMAEDIITALSKVSSLMVIARNSTFTYKGKAVDVRQVGQDQGVRYVLEGGVRKAGSRVRITAQLVDASTGKHLWAERYDRDLEDIFAVQDEITRKIVSELDVHLRVGEMARLWSGGTGNLEAWECVRMGVDLLDGYRAVDVSKALRLAQKAIELDPVFAEAWVLMSSCNWHAQEQPDISEKERERCLESAREHDHRALQIDPSCAIALAHLALNDLHLRKYDDALRNANKSVKFGPNNAIVVAISAAIMVKCGQPQKALERIQKAMRLSPVYPWWFLMMLGQSSRLLGMIEVAIDAYKEIIRLDLDSLEGHIGLAQILGESGKTIEASASAANLLRVNPEFSISEYVGNLAYSDPAENLRFAEGLRNAGLPE